MIRGYILCANLDNTRAVHITGRKNCTEIKIVSKHNILVLPCPIQNIVI